MTATIYPRFLEPRVADALADTPAVLIAGPRQVGKTTLARSFAESRGMRYLTLDNDLTLLAAKEDPTGLLRNLDRAVIDEVQRAPQLLLSLKKIIDEDRRSGRFLLTGSANLMALPTVADSLAGRMETLTLLPLSQAEMHGGRSNWLDSVFAGTLPAVRTSLVDDALVETVLRGGYPEAVARETFRRRNVWAKQYIDALLLRDVRELASIHKVDQLPRFLRALAQTAGQLCNYSKLGGQVGLDHKTAAVYLGIFEQMYLVKRVEPWANNRLKRVLKTPKLQFLDPGLLASLSGTTPGSISLDRKAFGHILESFVFAELLKHAQTAEESCQIFHYRDQDKREVDLVVENASGHIVGIEIKATASLKSGDVAGLKHLLEVAPEKFRMGVILYDGNEILPLGERLWAAPLSTLWG